MDAREHAISLTAGSERDGSAVRIEVRWRDVRLTRHRALLAIDGTVYRVVDRSVAPHGDDRGYLWLSPL